MAGQREAIPPKTEPEEPLEPIQIDWTKPPFLIAYGLIGLLCLFALYKWLFGPSRHPDLVRVRGTVTLDGKALAGAVVTFHPTTKEGIVAVGATDRFGKFDMKTAGLGSGALIGEYGVTVTKFASEEKMMTPEEAKEYTSQMGKPPPDPKVTNLLPTQYGSVQTSGLAVAVNRRGGQFKFELKEAP